MRAFQAQKHRRSDDLIQRAARRIRVRMVIAGAGTGAQAAVAQAPLALGYAALAGGVWGAVVANFQPLSGREARLIPSRIRA
jgi:hypothetical protein